MAPRLHGARPTPPIPAHGTGISGWDDVALGDVSSHAKSKQNQGGMGKGSSPVPYNPPQSRSGKVTAADPEESCGWSPSVEVDY